MHSSTFWIDQLKLQPHPEGGYFREIYASSTQIKTNGLKDVILGQDRRLATSIYYLLNSGETSKFHRLKSDELWYYHFGCSLIIYSINQPGILHEQRLGPNPEKGEVLQFLIPSGTIFAAMPSEPDSYSLLGCMVTPGFDFSDFEIFTEENLLRQFPQHGETIKKIYL